MLLTLTTTHRPATDLGHLLHKHPDRAQSFPLSSSRTAHVFYPVANDAECTVALLLDVDPVALVRGGESATLDQYVNDRPYVASSMLAVAIGAVFRTALSGNSALQELAGTAIPLQMHLPVVRTRGGAPLVHRLFGPLRWDVSTSELPLDPQFPSWGNAPYVDLRLRGTLRLADALKHLYVLLPVLDDTKHYWVSEDEIDKLLRAGDGWLAEHPERGLISRRYLRHQRPLVRSALSRLAQADDGDTAELDDALADARVTAEPQRGVPLAQQRRDTLIAVLRDLGAHRIIDLGCGGGALLREFAKHPQFTAVLGTDVSAAALTVAERVLERLPERVRNRFTLRQSALTYVDPELVGYDAAVLMEVIEHVDESRLPALERAVFGYARPASVLVTTPNVEYNVLFETLPAGHLRHQDHRFEWTRAQFHRWADGVAAHHGYTVRYLPIGTEDPDVGPPTQAAVFEMIP